MEDVMSITEIAIKRPTLIVVIFTILAVLGLTSYSLLNYDLIPKMSIPNITVATIYPGASAHEVESSITKPLEEALSSLDNVKSMQSTSQEGASTIMLELGTEADVNRVLQDAQRKVNTILAGLPSGAKTPSINKFSFDDMPIMKLGVIGSLPPKQLYQLVEDQIKPQLSKIGGVGQVSLVGGSKREIQISVKRDRLNAYQMSMDRIYAAIQAANLEMPTGSIESDYKQYTVRMKGKVTSLDQLRNLMLSRTTSGGIVRLGDIAEITDGIAEQTALNRINGQNSIGLLITKQSDANTVDICTKLKKQFTLLEKQYAGDHIVFDIAADNSTYTLASAHAVMEGLMLAIILVAFVMFCFLHSVRNSFIILVSIPCSIVSVFIAMYVFDFSLNMLTLMALSLVIGILVDDSIVVLENIHRHLEMGKNRTVAALDGRNEIGLTALAITFVDVVVLLLLSLVSGMIWHMLREFSLVILCSTLMSLFVSFTVTPLLASQLSKIEKLTRKRLIGRFAIWFEGSFKALLCKYESILRWALQHRRCVYGGVFALLLVSVVLLKLGLIGAAFMNDGDKGEFVIKLEGEPQNTLLQSSLLTDKVENLLRKHPEVVKVFSNVGYTSADMGMGSNGQYKSELTVTLVPKENRSMPVDAFAAMIKKEIQEIPGLKVTSTPSNMMGNADDAPIQLLLRGADVVQLFATADSVMGVVRKIPGTNDVKLSIDRSNPEIQIEFDREKMELLDISVRQVGNTLNMALAGNSDLKYSEGDKEYEINVEFNRFDRKSIEDIGSMKFQNSRGENIALSSFATLTQSTGPNKLERFNRMPSITVNASVFGRPVGTVGDEIKKAVKERIHLGPISLDYKGQMERQADAFSSLFIAIGAALLFVYLVMVALYNSYLYPFVVMFAIPGAVFGAFLALAVTGEALTIFSMIGMIMLIGLVAKNAILLVDFTNKLKEQGKSVTEALVEAGKERLRPILMTTLSMIFGMLPIALASGAGAESKNGLAWVIIGGLTSSLILTLVLVPSVYMTMEKYKSRIINLFRKKQPAIS